MEVETGEKGFYAFLKKRLFLSRSKKALGEIYDNICSAKSIKLSDLVVENAAMIIIDMVNGFVKSGAMSSPRVRAINDTVARLAGKCDRAGIPIAALADCHTASSPEFETYPVHCLAGDKESKITEEITENCVFKRIDKNSTNGFHEQELRDWIEQMNTDTFILVGDCTDICVLQLALAIKTWFNKQNRYSRVIVPINAVATYDSGAHNGDLCDVMALYNLTLNGIEIYSEIEY